MKKIEFAVIVLFITITGTFGEPSSKVCPPSSVADPSYPNCTCAEKNFAYIDYKNECIRVCPENSTGYWPNCECDDKLARFDKSKL